MADAAGAPAAAALAAAADVAAVGVVGGHAADAVAAAGEVEALLEQQRQLVLQKKALTKELKLKKGPRRPPA